MNLFITVHNTETILKDCNGNFFEAAKIIDRNYQRGIITETEMLEMMDVLAAKGIETKWGREGNDGIHGQGPERVKISR